MALLDNFQSKLDITYGSEDDICLYCAKEFMNNPDIAPEDNDAAYVQKHLRGKLNYKPIYKNKRRDLVICLEHLKKMVVEADINEK